MPKLTTLTDSELANELAYKRQMLRRGVAGSTYASQVARRFHALLAEQRRRSK